MEKNNILEILKQAILKEIRAKTLYLDVAQKSKSPEVRHIFEIMASEEQSHIDFLSTQYKNYSKTQSFTTTELNVKEQKIASIILSDDLKNQISSAGYEAAAISAAIELENKAIEFYTSQAQKATNNQEKEFFLFLANWERTHHEILLKLDKELTEKIWFDNQFWPF